VWLVQQRGLRWFALRIWKCFFNKSFLHSLDQHWILTSVSGTAELLNGSARAVAIGRGQEISDLDVMIRLLVSAAPHPNDPAADLTVNREMLILRCATTYLQ
jgi:hypothetical protein